MTTEQPNAQPDAVVRPAPVALRRRSADRVIGGVAGGLGDYLNVDPVLFRAAFAGLVIFGGAGLVLYVLGWLLIPEVGHDDSIAVGILRAASRRLGRAGIAIAVVAAVAIVSPWFVNRFGDGIYIQAPVFWAVAIAFIGFVLLVPSGGGRVAPGSGSLDSVGSPPMDAPSSARPSSAALSPTPATPWFAATTPATAPAARRDPSPLGWFVLAAVLGVVAALGIANAAAGVSVMPGQYLGAAVLVLGAGLVVGAWWGRARLLILLGLALLPVAAIASFLTVPLDGGIGRHSFEPRATAEIAPVYRLTAGELDLDLSRLRADVDALAVEATVGIGEVWIVVPDDASLTVTGEVRGGSLQILDRRHVGTDLTDTVTDPGLAGGPRITLNVAVGIGTVYVIRADSGF